MSGNNEDEQTMRVFLQINQEVHDPRCGYSISNFKYREHTKVYAPNRRHVDHVYFALKRSFETVCPVSAINFFYSVQHGMRKGLIKKVHTFKSKRRLKTVLQAESNNLNAPCIEIRRNYLMYVCTQKRPVNWTDSRL